MRRPVWGNASVEDIGGYCLKRSIRKAPFGRFILVDPRLLGAPVHFPVGRALPASSLARAKSTILTSSHVRPPSLDHDSS